MVLIVRRTTLEWLFREAALAQPGVELRPSSGVAGLIHHVVDGVPVVDGVRLEDGTEIDRRPVVDASAAGAARCRHCSASSASTSTSRSTRAG